MVKKFPDCTELPSSWSNVTVVNKTMPVEYGTQLTLSCREGFINMGANSVTCDAVDYFIYTGDQPFCGKNAGKCRNPQKWLDLR